MSFSALEAFPLLRLDQLKKVRMLGLFYTSEAVSNLTGGNKSGGRVDLVEMDYLGEGQKRESGRYKLVCNGEVVEYTCF